MRTSTCGRVLACLSKLRQSPAPNWHSQTSSATLRAIAEPTRLRLVALLSRGGADRHRDHPGHRAEPAAHQPPPAAARRRRRPGARARGRVRLLPARRRSAGAPTWRRHLAELAAARRRDRRRRPRRARARPPGARWQAAAAYRRRPRRRARRAPRDLYVAEAEVERAMLDVARRRGPDRRLLDIGTGTGRILELLAPAQRAQRRARPRSRHAAAGARRARRGPAVAARRSATATCTARRSRRRASTSRSCTTCCTCSTIRRRGDRRRAAAPARRAGC